MPMIDRRATFPVAVLFLAASYALRALIGVVEGGPNAGQVPEVEVEQKPVDPVLVPAHCALNAIHQRERTGHVRHPQAAPLSGPAEALAQ